MGGEQLSNGVLIAILSMSKAVTNYGVAITGREIIEDPSLVPLIVEEKGD
jgi:hypothetical protein